MKTIFRFIVNLLSFINIYIDLDSIALSFAYVRPNRCFCITIFIVDIVIYLPKIISKIEAIYISRTTVKIGNTFYPSRIARNNKFTKCYYYSSNLQSRVDYCNPILIGNNQVKVQDSYKNTFIYYQDELYYQLINTSVKGYLKNGVFYITSAVG
jgi:hypothetical protein